MLVRETVLMHYGVKGMKWGVRRYQNKDGSLTSKGKKHYTDDVNADVNTSKYKNPLKRHKQNLINKYMSNGYSKEAAEAKAKQRMITEATVAVVGGVAIAVVGKKVATRVGQDYCDKIIKSGHEIQNVGANSKETFKDRPFYAAINKHDKKAYGTLYPAEKRNNVRNESSMPYEGIYRNRLKVTKDIKRASNNSARKIMQDMLEKDPKYRKEVISAMNGTMYGWSDGKSPEKLLKENPKKFYDRFNQALATPQFQNNDVHKKFYKELEKHGYNALIDVNDTRYSRYKNIAKSPTIVFGKNVVEKMESNKYDEETIDINALRHLLKIQEQNKSIKKAAIVGAYGSEYVIARELYKQYRINKYLKEHPKSKLTADEILRES